MKIRTAPELGAAIRERRRLLRLAQIELASRVGVSRQWIIEVEKGKPRAEIGLVLRTLEILEIDLSISDVTKGTSWAKPAILDAIVNAARKRK
jgi:HTH-type transcriptional regulator/antitoxin HipB